MKIGLLEDNPAIVDYMSTALELAGHNVYTHTHASSLLETLFTPHWSVHASLPYDLLLVDLLLPGNISGAEAVQRIAQAIPPEKLPIIIVSACGQDELEQVKLTSPQVSLLRKPFKMNVLLQMIGEAKGVQ